jgi:protein involved in polysaccharide export with SLBB domain
MNQIINDYCLYHKRCFLILLVLAVVFGCSGNAVSQETRKYLAGEQNSVEMIVHIIGQVQKPGHYRVADSTNLIELLSEAGGPTEYSNLGNVTIAHVQLQSNLPADGQNVATHNMRKRISKYDINKYLKEDYVLPPPTLEPGDLVLVPKNRWSTWRNTATILRDVSVVASAYFLYLRAMRD